MLVILLRVFTKQAYFEQKVDCHGLDTCKPGETLSSLKLFMVKYLPSLYVHAHAYGFNL